MKLNKFFMLGLAGLAFAACSNDDAEETALSNVKKSVTLSIANMETPGSRSTGTATATEDAVADVDDLTVLFVAGDDIVDHKSLKDVAAVNDNEYTFHQVDNSVKKVAIVGHYAGVEAEKSLSALVTKLKDVASQQSTLENIYVYGVSNQWNEIGDCKDEETGVVSKLYDAGTIEVKPFVARVEITKIGCSDLGATSPEIARYSELTLGNIVIDNFYSIVDDESKLINYADETKWGAATGWNVDAVGATLTTVDPLEKTFVYNIAPGTTPRIILGITAAKFNDAAGLPGTPAVPYYVKATSYTGADKFEAGNIYKIEYIFTCDNVKPWQPSEEICIKAVVSIAKWTITDLTPKFE